MTTRPARYVVGPVEVSEARFEDVLTWLLGAPAHGEKLSAHFATAHTVVEAARDSALRRALAVADLVAADGMPLVWAGQLQGRRVNRVCGPDLMPALIERGRIHGARHYFYGGEPGVPERLAAALVSRAPGTTVVGTYSPPFRPLTLQEDAETVDRINATRPDYVWIGLGCPKQDLWLAEHRGRLNAAVLLAVGAAFNIHAGDLRRAPQWMRHIGLEWIFRLLMEPRRLWRRYTMRNLEFVWVMIAHAIRALGTRVRGVRRAEDEPRGAAHVSRQMPKQSIWTFLGIGTDSVSGNGSTDRPTSFLLLPRQNPKLVIPLASMATMRAALALYAPYKSGSRIAKQAATLFNRVGLLGHIGKTVAGNGRPFSDEIARRAHWPNCSIAFQLPPHSPAHVVTGAAIASAGDVLGFVKVALDDTGRRRLASETSALEGLARLDLEIARPHVMAEGVWQQCDFVVLSTLAGRPSPIEISSVHLQFLRGLIHGRTRPIGQSAYFEDLLQRFRLTPRAHIDMETATRVARRLDDLAQLSLPVAVCHGDFAPWNLRIDKELGAFDWERATLDGIPIVDEMHFIIRVGFLIRGWSAAKMHRELKRRGTQTLPDPHPSLLEPLWLAVGVDMYLRLIGEQRDLGDGEVVRQRGLVQLLADA